MTLSQLLYAYTCIPEVGPASLARIMESFANPDEAWVANSDQLLAIGLKPPTVRAINDKRTTINPLGVWDELVRSGVQTVTIHDNNYPTLLREIHRPPPLLTYRGNLPAAACVAIVGTRNCTPYGVEVARQLGRDLAAAGITIVSGLAFGIDAAGHAGALESNGLTAAVVGTGLGLTYPAEHRDLAQQILDSGGCLMSEYSLGTAGHPANFPRRNRIVSGLCRAVVVVEAGEKSGALLTAHLATEQNREVLAVPGPITSPASFGTNRLLKKGAAVCRGAGDVLEQIGLAASDPSPIAAPTPIPQLPPMSDLASKLYEAIPSSGASVDELGKELALGAAELAMAVTELELLGIVQRQGSNLGIKNLHY